MKAIENSLGFTIDSMFKLIKTIEHDIVELHDGRKFKIKLEEIKHE